MSEVCLTQMPLSSNGLDVSSSVASGPRSVQGSYDGSEVVFRLLRLETPGSALMNLGFFPIGGPLAMLNVLGSLGRAQMRLVYRSASTLQVGHGHQVLDVACGRGQSSYVLKCLNPRSEIVGIDLTERHIDAARTLFGQEDGLTYQTGNAMSLDFPDESFDRVMCLEAAFHFCDRSQFLSEAFRVLRPGGRLVVVDFAWNTEADRAHRNDPGVQLVRRIWSWDDLYSVAEYQSVAESFGFRDGGHRDWTNRVTAPLNAQLKCVSAVGGTSLGRRFLRWKNPLYHSFTPRDFAICREAAEAHAEVQRRSRYMAFAFDKPVANGA